MFSKSDPVRDSSSILWAFIAPLQQRNRLMERPHKQLKSSLISQIRRSKFSAFILLSTRPTMKEDFQCTTAQLVYGASLTLPDQLIMRKGAFVCSDPSSFCERLMSHMNDSKSVSND